MFSVKVDLPEGVIMPTLADLIKSLKGKKYKNDTVAYFKCVRASSAVNKNEKTKSYGDLQLITEWAALSDPEDLDSTVSKTIRDTMSIPVVNKDIPGHTIPPADKYAGKMHALFPQQVPDQPRGKDGVYTFDGKTIEGNDQYTTCKAKAVIKGLNVGLRVFGNPKELVGTVIIGTVWRPQDSEYTNLTRWTAPDELQNDVQLSDPDDFLEEADLSSFDLGADPEDEMTKAEEAKPAKKAPARKRK
jgi:hypothetical protein